MLTNVVSVILPVGITMTEILERTQILMNDWRYLMCKKASFIMQCGKNASLDILLASLNL
jgi:hypothetical protein